MNKKVTKEIEETICKLYHIDNMSVDSIIPIVGLSSSCIFKILTKNNIPRKNKVCIGENRKKPKNSNTGKKYYVNEKFFKNLDTKESAYLAGLISADGSMSKTSNAIKIELKLTDKEILEKIVIMLDSNYPIREEHRVDKRNNKSYSSCSLSLCREQLYKDLENHGITSNKSHNLRIPSSIPYNLMHYYIRGWADGDAGWSISKNKSLFFTLISSSHDYLIDLKNILEKECNLDIDCKVHDISHEHCYKLIYSGNCQARKIFDYLYQGDLQPKLERKYNLCKNHFDEYDLKYPGKYLKYLTNQDTESDQIN